MRGVGIWSHTEPGAGILGRDRPPVSTQRLRDQTTWPTMHPIDEKWGASVPCARA
jgi:hypothetical protein